MTWSMKRKSRLAECEHSIDKKLSMDIAQVPQPHILLFTHKLYDQVLLTTGLWLMEILMVKEVKMRYPHLLGRISGSGSIILQNSSFLAAVSMTTPCLDFTSSRALSRVSSHSGLLQTPSLYYVAIHCLVPQCLFNLYYQTVRLKYSKQFIFFTLTSVFDCDWSVPFHVRL